MRNWSITIATILGIEVRVHVTFLLLLVFVWLTQAPQGAGPERALALVAIVFGAVVVHEMGHAIAARRAGISARSIILLPIGGISLADDTARRHATTNQEVSVAIAGPAANLAVAAVVAAFVSVWASQSLLRQPWIDATHLGRSLVWTNVLLGVFNLLPAYPLDGGRILRAVFLQRYDPMHATRRAAGLGQFFSTAFLFAGIAAAIYGRDWGHWLMLLGFFLFVGGQLEDRSAIFRAVLETVRMEDVMLTDFATLSPGDTLESALAKAIHTLQDDFPVIRGSELVGVISRQRILENLRLEGNGYIQAAMNRAFDVAQRRDSLASAFRKITVQGATLIPVVEEERLVGIVTLQNLMHSMALLAETRKLQRAR